MIFLRVETEKASLLYCEKGVFTLQIDHRYQRNTQRTLPPAVGADSSYSYFRLTILTHFCFHARIFVLSNTHFHFTEYIYSHHRIHIYSSSYTHFRSTFRGCIQICGHDKSPPTAAYRLSKILRTNYKNATFTQQNTLLTLRKYATLTVQKCRYYIAKLLYL